MRSKEKSAEGCWKEAGAVGGEGGEVRLGTDCCDTEARVKGTTEKEGFDGALIAAVVERPPTRCLISLIPEEELLV